MTRPIVLLGEKGRLASFIKRKRPEVQAYSREAIDLTDHQRVRMQMQRLEPALIINCAALTDVEYCERHPKVCWQVNVEGVRNLAAVADQTGAKLIHFSSSYALAPVNEYGKSKLAGEAWVAPKGLVVRSDMYDTQTFIIRKLLRTREALEAYSDKFFNPIYMGTVADLIFIYQDRVGVMNLGTNQRISMAEFALEVCHVFGLSPSRVKLISSEELPGKAKRPKEMFLEPDIDVSLDADLRKFNNDLKEQGDLNYQPASR
jgi:dTDP-4-dehydrorhamnose reductase